jgi:phosphate-selective porin OprO/OprP
LSAGLACDSFLVFVANLIWESKPIVGAEMRGLDFFPKSASEKIMHHKCRIAFLLLSLLFLFWTGPVWAISADDLLKLLIEENVITPEKAEKIKEKARQLDRAKKAREEAKRAREWERIKQETKAEAKAEAIKEARAIAQKSKPKWKVNWQDGLNIQSNDGKNKIKIGGRIQADFASISSNKPSLVDQLEAEQGGNDLTGFGTEFRRARLFVEGTVYDIIQFKAQYDFAGGDAEFKDVWLGLRRVPYVGHIRVGHQKEPFSLEELTSSNYLTFMERALPNVFAPGRNTGILAFNTAFKSKRLWWGLGIFQDADDLGDSFNNFQDWNFTARVAGTAIYLDKGRKLLHLGLGYSHQFRNQDQFSLHYRQRPEAHITKVRPLDTRGAGLPGLDAGSVDLINPEIALVWGPFSLQGEYMWSFVNARRDSIWQNGAEVGGWNLFLKEGNPTFHGGYVYASYFLTGENRNYELKSATFGRIKPRRNFDLQGGPGAWEVAFRYSYLNLNSRVSSDPNALFTPRVGVRGGIENNLTFALNWYQTPNTRWMFNYVYADIGNRRFVPGMPTNRYTNNRNYNSGPLHIVETRFQIDF